MRKVRRRNLHVFQSGPIQQPHPIAAGKEGRQCIGVDELSVNQAVQIGGAGYAAGTDHTECVVIADVDSARVAEVRDAFRFLPDRRG